MADGATASDRAKSVDDGLGDSTSCAHEVAGGEVYVRSVANVVPGKVMACERLTTEDVWSDVEPFVVPVDGDLLAVRMV